MKGPPSLDSDWDFDRIYPKDVQKLSRIHWTPVEVARAAAAWLAPGPGAKVLDVGSGVGKLCIVGALTTRGHFTGVEHREAYVALSKALCREHKIGNVRFVHGDALAQDWSAFDGIYLYNPFGSEDASSEQFVLDVDRLEAQLARVRPGARLAVYCGYGGKTPVSYALESSERVGGGLLELYTKVTS
jgi:SAM-dependent methyltransferase